MENKESGQEKRETKRVHKNLIVQYSTSPASGARKWDVALIQDIGEKGVSFIVNDAIPVAAAMDMLIKIPFRPFDWFEFTGKLVACEEFKEKKENSSVKTFLARVAFLDLKDEQKSLIHEYVSWCLSKHGGVK